MTTYFFWIIRKLFILIVGLSLSVISYADDPVTAPPPEKTVVAKVVWVKGNVTDITPDKQTRSLHQSDSIYLHDTILTDDSTEAQIVFTDNTLMTFQPGTKFYIDEYTYNAKSTTGSVGKYVMDLVKGGFRTITGFIAKANPSDYKVNTPVATIGVRGTDYSVYLDKEGKVFLAYHSGSPCITSGSVLCLGAGIPYARVSGAQSKPVPLTTKPAVFNQKSTIVKTTFTTVAATGAVKSTSTPSAVKGANSTVDTTPAPSTSTTKPGDTGGFCIQ